MLFHTLKDLEDHEDTEQGGQVEEDTPAPALVIPQNQVAGSKGGSSSSGKAGADKRTKEASKKGTKQVPTNKRKASSQTANDDAMQVVSNPIVCFSRSR